MDSDETAVVARHQRALPDLQLARVALQRIYGDRPFVFMVENEDAQGKVVDVVSNGASASDPAHGLVYRLIHAVIGQVDRGEIKL